MTRSECPVVAATGGHVDDCVFVWKEGNNVWEATRKQQLQDHFRWKMWEYDNFIQCGVRVEQKDGGFLLSQSAFVDELREIQIPSRRRKEKDRPVSQQEQTELRGLRSDLGWKCEQTDPQLSAAAVPDMIEASRLLQQVKKESGQAIRIFSFTTEELLALIGLCDAALQKPNRWTKHKRYTLHMLFREGFAGRGILDVCDQLEKWPNGHNVSQCHVCRDESQCGSGGLGNTTMANSPDWYLTHV